MTLRDQVAKLQAENAELRSQLASAEEALTGAATAPAGTGPVPGTPVWLRDAGGREWEVEVASTAYEQLLVGGAALFTPEAAADEA